MTDTDAMHRSRILIADDTPEKLTAMKRIVADAEPRAIIDTASSVREALVLTTIRGKLYDRAVIDYDFPLEKRTGADIIRSLRRTNARSTIVCATAREEGRTFDDARDETCAVGANEALCFLRDDFEESLRSALISGA